MTTTDNNDKRNDYHDNKAINIMTAKDIDDNNKQAAGRNRTRHFAYVCMYAYTVIHASHMSHTIHAYTHTIHTTSQRPLRVHRTRHFSELREQWHIKYTEYSTLTIICIVCVQIPVYSY